MSFLTRLLGDSKTQKQEGLMKAVEERQLERVKKYLMQGADPNVGRSASAVTPLAAAAGNSWIYPKVVECLLASGAEPELADKWGLTPLHRAAQSGNLPAVELLLAAGADPRNEANGSGTPLHWAASSSSLDVVRRLLLAGVDPNSADKGGKTPLHSAAKYSYLSQVPDILLALIAAGADPERKDKNGQTARDMIEAEISRSDLTDKLRLQSKRALSCLPDKPDAPAQPTDVVEEAKDIIRNSRGAHDFLSRATQAGWSTIKEDSIGIYLKKGDATLIFGVLPSRGPDTIWNAMMTTRDTGTVHLISEGKIVGGGTPPTKPTQAPSQQTPPQAPPRAESSVDIATASVSRAFETHIKKKLEPQSRTERETQAALNKVAAVFRQTSRAIGEKILLSATDGEMHSCSFRDVAQKVRLEVTTIPCRPSEAYDYFARTGSYESFLDRLLYLPAVYQPSRAEGIQVFAHLIVVVDPKSQCDQSGQDQVVVHLCMLPHGDGNQPYCPVGITPTDLLERR